MVTAKDDARTSSGVERGVSDHPLRAAEDRESSTASASSSYSNVKIATDSAEKANNGGEEYETFQKHACHVATQSDDHCVADIKQ